MKTRRLPKQTDRRTEPLRWISAEYGTEAYSSAGELTSHDRVSIVADERRKGPGGKCNQASPWRRSLSSLRGADDSSWRSDRLDTGFTRADANDIFEA